MEHLSLYELNKTISDALAKHLEPSYWVVAEIGQMQTNQKGHCYLELVEKEDNQIKAKTRATIWSYTYRNLSTWFHGITGQNLKTGMKILFNATVQYHEVYGFSLNIRDIDAQYTLGERAKKRQEIIMQLQEDGIFEMNKELELPLVPQRLAVISSSTAAGYGDFMDQLNSNEFGYEFDVKLFNSVMQGDQAEASIISSIHQIFEKIEEIDLLVIIRGGGASLDLDCFDGYDLGTHIAQFPIPIITGIGHDRDETIADMVAHTKMKTPTAVAEFIISGYRNYELKLNDLFNHLSAQLSNKLEAEKANLDQSLFRFQRFVQHRIFDQNTSVNNFLHQVESGYQKALKIHKLKLDGHGHSISNKPSQIIKSQANLLNHLERELIVMDPEHVLKRGYSITTINGKNIDNLEEIKQGSTLTTITKKHKIESKYTSGKKRK